MSERYRMPVSLAAENNPHSFALDMVGSSRTVLELGCSGGHVTELLVAAGNTVVGVESDPVWAAEASKFAERVHVLDLDVDSVADVESGRFDVIVAGDVLEHLRDPLAALVKVLPLLKPGGDVIISVPNMAYVDVRLLMLEGRIEYQDEGLLDRTHLRWFTRDSLRDLIEHAGLAAVEVRRVVHPMGSSRLPVDWDAHSEVTRSFVLSDPEATTYQFVVRCVRATEAGDRDTDLLTTEPHEWPVHHCETAEALAVELDVLRAEISSLQAAVEAWERSRTARVTLPLRKLLSRIRSDR
jgi:SAM-dependent methyltransferase